MGYLDENKKLYKQCADINLPDWENLSKSELCNLYTTTNKKSEQEGAVAALIYKCWNIFNKHYRDQPYIPVEDWYDSMIEAIMYVLKSKVWLNPKSNLYNDPVGPEKALHRCIWSRKLNVYGLSQKPKRVINLNLMSTEDLYERAGVDVPCEIDEEKYIFNLYIKKLIEKGKPEYAIVLDLIIQGVPYNKLCYEIRRLDLNYCEQFSRTYGLEISRVENNLQILQNNKNLSQYIDYYITCLQRDQDTINYLI